jgi:hypothetical protein
MNAFCLRLGLCAAPLLPLASCSSPADDTPAVSGQGVESSGDRGTDDGVAESESSDFDSTSTGEDDEDDSDTTGSSTGVPPGPSAGYAECPDALPEAWVLCEDFEAIEDPTKTFFEFQDGDGAFVLGQGDAASGTRSMRTKYREGVEGSGWLSVAIGRNPVVYGDRPNAAAGGDFTEIYWRFRVKTQAGWPDIGLGHLTSATVLASSEWTQAMVARLRSDGDNVVLLAEPTTCIEGGAVSCTGFEDAMGQKHLGGLVGAMPIFSQAAADEWHCVEAHVVLNTPGLADGVFEFWVDDTLENGAYQLDWRGTWAEYGINLVTLENFWPGGAPADLERAVDDLVISTAPIGCE